MNRYQDITGKINYGLFLAVVFLLPFPQIALRYACVAWIISWFFEGRWLRIDHLKSQFARTKFAIPFILFALWYLWRILSAVWVTDSHAWGSQIERYLTFGLLLPVGLWGVNKKYDLQQIGRALVTSCVVAVPIYLTLFAVLFYHREIIDTLQWEGRWNYAMTTWYTFVGENISVVKHRLYFCAVELLGAIVAYILYRRRPWVLFPTVAVMLSSILITGSRQSIVTAAILFAIACIYELPQKHRIWYGIGIIVLGLAAGGGLLKMHPRMQQFDLHSVTAITEINETHEERLNIWGAALQQPQDYLWYGLGAGQSANYMKAQYEQLGMTTYAQKGYNCHNQYLEEIMELGLFGLLLFLIAWCTIPICTHGKAQMMAWMFTLLYACNMVTECIFGRFDGIALWAVGMILIALFERSSTAPEAYTD